MPASLGVVVLEHVADLKLADLAVGGLDLESAFEDDDDVLPRRVLRRRGDQPWSTIERTSEPTWKSESFVRSAKITSYAG